MFPPPKQENKVAKHPPPDFLIERGLEVGVVLGRVVEEEGAGARIVGTEVGAAGVVVVVVEGTTVATSGVPLMVLMVES